MSKYIPERGDIVYINFSPQTGHEQAGVRPAIVLSLKPFNSGKFIVACPITKKEKGYPFEVKIPKGINVQGVVLSDQIRSLDWRARNVTFVCKSPTETLHECLEKISLFVPYTDN